ncbi:MAG TPA: MurT ligase domain-containing protein [Candidatus Saccharimonadia bacterium]|nr:MurT ligase domain-containing protein [Candidatus Saccharimonadia bacterium]
MPPLLTLAITKVALGLSRRLGRGSGTALPGLLAERLDPHLARKLASSLPNGIILVTGTNGKTTTTKMIAAMLEASGERVLTNRAGSNLKRGVVSALIEAASVRGRVSATIGLFEVDEASLRLVAPDLQPRQIVVTNLFRDQLDRYGELDTTAALIGQGIAATTAHLYLNADDPLVASLAKYAAPERVSYYGIEGLPAQAATAQTASDSDRCPLCGARLRFSRTFYGHLGHYRCPTGDFGRPQPSVAVTSVEQANLEGSSFTLAVNGKRQVLRLPLPGTYNLYNALAALSLAAGLGINAGVVARSLAETGAAFGRVERVELQGRHLYLLLIKNPAGFTQILETFLLSQKSAHVLFIINDNYADGRDVSWLWDVPLEALAPNRPTVWTAGVRGADMALRLHYAGISATVQSNTAEALRRLVASTPAGGTAFILPTYTAMLELRQILAKQTTLQEAGV